MEKLWKVLQNISNNLPASPSVQRRDGVALKGWSDKILIVFFLMSGVLCVNVVIHSELVVVK